MTRGCQLVYATEGWFRLVAQERDLLHCRTAPLDQSVSQLGIKWLSVPAAVADGRL